MKNRTVSNQAAWLTVVALAGLAVTTPLAPAAKPPPPPPPDYTALHLDGLTMEDINHQGMIAITEDTGSGVSRVGLIVPADANGDGFPETYHRDANGDGINDLVIIIGYPEIDDAIGYSGRINEAGQIAGAYQQIASDGTLIHRYFVVTPRDTNGDGRLEWYTPDAAGRNTLMTLLEPTRVNVQGEASVWAFNDSGQMVVTVEKRPCLIAGQDRDGDGMAEVWFEDLDQDGVNDLMTDLGSVVSSTGELRNPSVRAMNDDGLIVGAYGQYPTGFVLVPEIDPATGGKVWFRAGPGGVNALVKPLPENATEANDINAAGHIAGTFTDPATGKYRAGRWQQSPDGTWNLTPIGLLPGFSSAFAYGWGINNHEQVVGYSQTSRTTGRWPYEVVSFACFIWENGVLKDFTSVMEGTNPYKGPDYFYPREINDQGVFRGTGPGGSWLIVPIKK